MNALRTLLLGFPLMVAIPSSAQLPTVDITLVDNGLGEVEVRFRPDLAFDGLFSGLVFTIRWETVSGATLGNVSQPLPVMQYIPTGKSGDEEDAGGYRYQIFAGFGFTPLNSIGQSWTPATEYVLCTIPVLGGSSVFEIVNDSWTADFNGDYFVSLNGQDQTGVIYTGSTGFPSMGATGPVMELTPNPSDGHSTLTLEVPDVADIHLEVLNAAGQLVLDRSYPRFSGTLRDSLDLSKAGQGVYVVNLDVAGARQMQRLVVR